MEIGVKSDGHPKCKDVALPRPYTQQENRPGI